MPDAIATAESSFEVYLEVTRIAEAAKLDAIFFADAAAVQPVDLIARGDPRAGLVHRGAAGLEPLTEGSGAWWIIDYKTALAEELGPLSALSELRNIFAPQLEAYSAVLRNLHGKDARIRAALYYPRMSLLDWWEVN